MNPGASGSGSGAWPDVRRWRRRHALLQRSLVLGRQRTLEGVPGLQALQVQAPEDGLDLEGLINTIEKDLLLKALERSQWVKKRAARLLRLNTRSFRYRLEKYEIKGGRD